MIERQTVLLARAESLPEDRQANMALTLEGLMSQDALNLRVGENSAQGGQPLEKPFAEDDPEALARLLGRAGLAPFTPEELDALRRLDAEPDDPADDAEVSAYFARLG